MACDWYYEPGLNYYRVLRGADERGTGWMERVLRDGATAQAGWDFLVLPPGADLSGFARRAEVVYTEPLTGTQLLAPLRAR